MIAEQVEKIAGGFDKPLSIGIMGGTFDPVHFGHLYCAEQARVACGLDVVIFIPAGKPSFKSGRQQAPFQDRMRMCELAISSNPYFLASDIEFDEMRTTYTIDTIKRLRQSLSDNIDISFIAGTDAINSLHRWKDAGELSLLCKFICVRRLDERNDGITGSSFKTLEQMGFEIQTVRAPMLDISSSDIRDRIRQGGSIRYIVPDPVSEYIYRRGLYV